jgi:hypothetical protein
MNANRLVVVLSAAFFLPVFAFRTAAAPVSGQVTNPEGAPLASTTVHVSPGGQRAQTDPSGWYAIALPAGRHALTFHHAASEPRTVEIELGPVPAERSVQLPPRILAPAAPPAPLPASTRCDVPGCPFDHVRSGGGSGTSWKEVLIFGASLVSTVLVALNAN